MGDHNSGGGGSVYWKIELDHVPEVNTVAGPKEWTELGYDEDPDRIDGKWFTVSIKVPQGFPGGRTGYLKALRDPKSWWGIRESPEPNRVYFNVDLEEQRDKNPTQIRTSWGRSKNVITPTVRRPRPPR